MWACIFVIVFGPACFFGPACGTLFNFILWVSVQLEFDKDTNIRLLSLFFSFNLKTILH